MRIQLINILLLFSFILVNLSGPINYLKSQKCVTVELEDISDKEDDTEAGSDIELDDVIQNVMYSAITVFAELSDFQNHNSGKAFSVPISINTPPPEIKSV